MSDALNICSMGCWAFATTPPCWRNSSAYVSTTGLWTLWPRQGMFTPIGTCGMGMGMIRQKLGGLGYEF